MIKRNYKKVTNKIEQNRFVLLLFSTLLLLILPAFAGTGLLYQFILVLTLSFLFIQSMLAADFKKSWKRIVRIVVLGMIIIVWLKPIGVNSIILDVAKNIFLVLFFTIIILHLIRYITKSKKVNQNVLLLSVNIYLLAGIVGASIAKILYIFYPDAYNFPSYIINPDFVHFLYYSFVTMTTVGYGDIIPRIPESQMLAYVIAIFGQLYVAIIISFLIGKYLMHSDSDNSKREEI